MTEKLEVNELDDMAGGKLIHLDKLREHIRKCKADGQCLESVLGSVITYPNYSRYTDGTPGDIGDLIDYTTEFYNSLP